MKITFNDISKRLKRNIRTEHAEYNINEVQLYSNDNSFIENNANYVLRHWEDFSEDTNMAFSKAVDVFIEMCDNTNTDKCDKAFTFLLSEVSKVRDLSQLVNSIKYKNSRLKSKILTKINNKLSDQKDSLTGSISDIENKLKPVLPSSSGSGSNGVASEPKIESYLNELLSETTKLIECDRIIRNYNTIIKRFDIDKIISEVCNTNDIYFAINDICKCIETYNSPFMNKYNTALEVSYYALNKAYIDYPQESIVEAVTDYYIFNDTLDESKCNSIDYLRRNNVIFESDIFDKVDYLFDTKKKSDEIEEEQPKADDYGVSFHTLTESDLEDTVRKIRSDVKTWVKGNPDERQDKEVEKMIKDFKAQCAKTDKDTNSNMLLTHLKSLINKLFTKSPDQIINKIPSIFIIIRGSFIVGTTAINPVLGIITLLTNSIIKLSVERKQVEKFISKYKSEISSVNGKIDKAKDDYSRDRLEKYKKELEKDLSKLKEYSRTIHSDDENMDSDDDDSSYDFDDDFNFDFDDDDDFNLESFTQSQLNNASTIIMISNLMESINTSLNNNSTEDLIIESMSSFSDDIIDDITDFSITVPSVLNKTKLYESLINYRNSLRAKENKYTNDYMRIDSINNNIYKINESINTYNINNDSKSVICTLMWLNEMTKFNNPTGYVNEMNFTNTLKLALNRLKNTALKLSDKEKQISNSIDVAVNNVSKGLEKAVTNDNREAVIKGQILPSGSKAIKLALITGATWAVNPAVAVIGALGYFACSKGLKAKERQLVLDDIEIELKMCERYLHQAEEKNDMKAIRQIEITQRSLERQRQRIKYKMHVIYNQNVPDVKSND